MTAVDRVQITAQDLLAGPAAFEKLVAGIPEADRARAVMYRHGQDLLSTPGSVAVTWFRTAPNSLTLSYSDTGHRELGRAVVRDAVAGVQMLFKADPRTDPPMPNAEAGQERSGLPPKPGFWTSVANMRRAISAMPGVHNFTGSAVGDRQYLLTFLTQTGDDAARLAAVVNPVLSNENGEFQVQFRSTGT